MKEDPALDAVVGFRWVIDRPVGQAATDQPVRVVAAARHALARDRLTSRVDAANVCADGTADPLRISRAIGIHVLEIVQLFGRHPSLRAVRVR